MSNSLSTRAVKSKAAELPISFGFIVVVLFFVASGLVSYMNIRTLDRDSDLVTHTHDVITALDDLESLMRDAETGQRGYVLTGSEKYLEPYTSALNHIEERIGDIEQLVADNPAQVARVPVIKAHIQTKLNELSATINLRRTQGFDAAREVVMTDSGKAAMDAFRTQASLMQEEETRLRLERIAEMNRAYGIAVVSGLLTGLLGIVLSLVVAGLMQREANVRRRQMWLQTGEAGLSSAMLGDQPIEQLGESILKFLAEYFDAHAGAVFTKDGNEYRRIATYGVPSDAATPEQFKQDDGLLWQAVKDKRAFFINDVPNGYLAFGSALGRGSPRYLAIAPAIAEDDANAVLELGFVHPLNDMAIELLNRMSESIGVAVQSAHYRSNLQNLLEETQRQAEELQAQSEELRVSNEELEEQGRILKESQTRLEQQQAELEQTNAQLEEQTQLLEGQRDDLERAKSAVQAKAKELQQASQYKSDFLANMSHELRTPLNSSLILAKLLADNPTGNLSEEQIRFAQTIQTSGNDLLALINDILDLSKIEAGHMEVRPETVSIDSMIKDLTRVFEPMTAQKGLMFKIGAIQGCPETIETDRLRLEQIIKNLLSNAIKFTEKGQIELNVSCSAGGSVSFAVTDTGIGIPGEQQQVIFEAFRQADGTISRKFGGTGLGLSISRELVRLLGGQISLASEQGKGSTFTVTIPNVYDPKRVAPRVPTVGSEATIFTPPDDTDRRKPAAPVRRMQDDREKLVSGKRTILVIEDDESFARILYELSHELDFQCLISTTAEDALVVARQYQPNAVILDVGLPDHSGLSVLDRMKRDPRMRHIPVHVISADDYTQTALSLGAAGYMIKPVMRRELVNTLKQLETKLSQRLRRVLIVEDDPVQQDSMRKLLGSHEIETVGVGTAAECLDLLKGSDFDCMVLDLSLPDSSGYTLLETLSKGDAYSFPPVIVYTGRELSLDEEQKLRRYSKSIIIKGAKSPERLLDEVTLFLHQVVSDLPPEQQKMLEQARNRDAVLEKRKILVVEDDVANIFALTSILEPHGVIVEIARNGREALVALEKNAGTPDEIDLVLMDVMMPEMDGMTATREIRKNPKWKKLPVIMLTAKAMQDDQERCLDAGANDYMAKPLDVEKLLSLVRVWMPR